MNETFIRRILKYGCSFSEGLSLALIHKHAKLNVGKWILETTRPQKHVHIPDDHFCSLASLIMIVPNTILFKSLNISDFTINIS